MIDQKKIHRQCFNEDPKERTKALKKLTDNFSLLPDKYQAWKDIHRLTYDENSLVRLSVTSSLASVFSHLQDKQQAWNDLIKLVTDEDWGVRYKASQALIFVFPKVVDKRQAWDDLQKLISNENSDVRSGIAFTFGSGFSYLPDKQQAWNELTKLTTDKDWNVRFRASSALCLAYSHMPDKVQAWKDLQKLITNQDTYVKSGIVSTFNSVFFHVPDKQQAWNILIELTTDRNWDVRYDAFSSLVSAFPQTPDKQRAWNDIIKLTNDEYSYVRHKAASTLCLVFSQMPYKRQAYVDLRTLTKNKDSYVRSEFAATLGFAFSHIEDKQQAWNDLIKLTYDQDWDVMHNAASALASALNCVFYSIQDIDEAWNYLHSLTSHEKWAVRYSVASVLGSVFSFVPDKQQAWNDLIKLATDEDWDVRHKASPALGYVFSQVPNKQHVWNDLVKLTIHKKQDIRMYANHSLGKVSIFKASQAEKEEDYKKELEKAIVFFEKAAKESYHWANNPSQFCLPFYRSFHTIIFKQEEEETINKKVDKYLAEAKYAIEGSKSKKMLIEAVENLSNALKEVQSRGNLNLEAKKDELNFYRIYCDRATELINGTEETAPFATIALKKGLPILGRNLKKFIEEIQEKAKIACQVSQGTLTQEIACSINKEIQKWGIDSQEEIAFNVESFIFTLESKIPRFPENQHIFKMINESKDQKDINKLLQNASELIEIIPEITIDPERMKPSIGIITALAKEYVAVNVLLENKKDKYKIPGSGAGRRYCLGEILSEEGNKHNLVLATSGMGNNIAATRAALLLEHFPNVKSIIMVGIAGGVPHPHKDKVDDHVRLGDIVISNENGVIQYDLIKQEIQEITYRNPPRPPSASLMEAVRYLEAEEILGNRPWEKYIAQSLSQLRIDRPSDDKDILHDSDNQDKIIHHPKDPKRVKGQPRVFFGPIASANILQKDPSARDKLRDKFKVKAIEMEASGIADATWNLEVGYLVVRGICDYCDSHKSDDWQQYAAIVAAAYTRALIESMP